MNLVDLATLCANHLAAEESLLNAIQPSVCALKEAFARAGFDSLQAVAERQRTFVQMIDDMKARRARLRTELAGSLDIPLSEATLTRVVECFPEPGRQTMHLAIMRIRALAAELASVNHWLAVHLRVHLDVYQRLLRDLTGTAPGSGRYGPRGNTEAMVYRPFLEIHG